MINGYVFKNQTFPSEIFALFQNTFLDGAEGIISGYKDSMPVTYNGSNVSIGSGVCCIQGRFLGEDSSTTIDAGTNTLYNILVITINLDRDNSTTELNQCYYEIVTSSSGYPTLTHDDIINTNSGEYQFELARFQTNASGIYNFVDKRTFLDYDSIFENLRARSTATQSENGLMSSADKTKLDNVETGAQVNSITGIKGNAENSYRTGNVNLTPANIGALPVSGGSLTGNVNTKSFIPTSNNSFDLGNSSRFYKKLFVKSFQNGQYDLALDWDGVVPVLTINGTTLFRVAGTMSNSVRFEWTGSNLAVYIGGTFVGYLAFSS